MATRTASAKNAGTRKDIATRFKPGVSGNPAGRKKGGKNKRLTELERMAMAQRHGILPLDFLMSVLRDDNVRFAAKVEAAKAAAPYIHRKMPIAIEGGDPDKPLRLDVTTLKKLTGTELAALRVILEKMGFSGLEDPRDGSPSA